MKEKMRNIKTSGRFDQPTMVTPDSPVWGRLPNPWPVDSTVLLSIIRGNASRQAFRGLVQSSPPPRYKTRGSFSSYEHADDEFSDANSDIYNNLSACGPCEGLGEYQHDIQAGQGFYAPLSTRMPASEPVSPVSSCCLTDCGHVEDFPSPSPCSPPSLRHYHSDDDYFAKEHTESTHTSPDAATRLEKRMTRPAMSHRNSGKEFNTAPTKDARFSWTPDLLSFDEIRTRNAAE